MVIILRIYHTQNLDNETAVFFRETDSGAGAGSEFKKVMFNPVTENNTLFGHL